MTTQVPFDYFVDKLNEMVYINVDSLKITYWRIYREVAKRWPGYEYQLCSERSITKMREFCE